MKDELLRVIGDGIFANLLLQDNKQGVKIPVPHEKRVVEEERKERGLGYVHSDDDDDDEDGNFDDDNDEDDDESEGDDEDRTVTLQEVQDFLQPSGYDIPMIDMMKEKSMASLLSVSLMTLENCVSNPVGRRIKVINDARHHLAVPRRTARCTSSLCAGSIC